MSTTILVNGGMAGGCELLEPSACVAGLLDVLKGDLEQARIRLEKAVQYMPGAPAAHYQLGLLYRRLGQRKKSEYHLQKSK